MANTDSSDRAAPYQVRVLDRAIDILDVLTARGADLSIRDIVEATGLNRSTAIRLCANLERRGLLQRDDTTGRFRLGYRLFEMGSAVYSSLSLLQAAAGPLSALEQRSGATIVLAVRDRDHSVTLDKRQGVGDHFAMVRMPGEVGTVHPLTHGPVGQVFLSALPSGEVESLLDRYPLQQHTPYSVLDREQFMARLAKIKADGYAQDVSEVVEGLMGLAAPIYDFAGRTTGVLALGLPATREHDTAFVAEAVRNLKQAAEEVSANLGYTGGMTTEEQGETPEDEEA